MYKILQGTYINIHVVVVTIHGPKWVTTLAWVGGGLLIYMNTDLQKFIHDKPSTPLQALPMTELPIGALFLDNWA